MWAAGLLLGRLQQDHPQQRPQQQHQKDGLLVQDRVCAKPRRGRGDPASERRAATQPCALEALRLSAHQRLTAVPARYTKGRVPFQLQKSSLHDRHYCLAFQAQSTSHPPAALLPSSCPLSPRRGCDPHPHRQHPPEGWPPRSPPVEEQPAPCSAGGAPAARAVLLPVLVLVVGLSLLVA